jgi:hypothetical protein
MLRPLDWTPQSAVLLVVMRNIIEATKEGKSLNAYVADVLERG